MRVTWIERAGNFCYKTLLILTCHFEDTGWAVPISLAGNLPGVLEVRILEHKFPLLALHYDLDSAVLDVDLLAVSVPGDLSISRLDINLKLTSVMLDNILTFQLWCEGVWIFWDKNENYTCELKIDKLMSYLARNKREGHIFLFLWPAIWFLNTCNVNICPVVQARDV